VGAAVALGLEMLQARIRGRNHLASILEGQPIAVIPYIYSDADKKSRWPLAKPFAGKRAKHRNPIEQPELAL
jgi:hypothetical protein